MKAPWRKLTEFQTACIALVAVVVVVVTVAWWALAPRRRSRMEQPVQFPPNAGPGEMRAELRDLQPFKALLGPTARFIGEIHNTGSAPILSPGARLTILHKNSHGDYYEASGDPAVCRTEVHILYPGERAPCAFRFEAVRHDGWASYRITPFPLRAPPEGAARPKLEVFDVKLKPPPREGEPHVTGKVRNLSGRELRNVRAVASIYDSDGKIVGADADLVEVNPAAKGLDKYIMGIGAVGSFDAFFYDWAAEPKTCAVIATAEDPEHSGVTQ